MVVSLSLSLCSTHTTPSSIRRRNRLSTNSTTSSPPQVPPPHSIRPPPHTLTRTRASSPSRANLLVGREGRLSPSRANSLVGREGRLSPSRANSLVGSDERLSPSRANSLVGTCSLSYKIMHIQQQFELLSPPPPSVEWAKKKKRSEKTVQKLRDNIKHLSNENKRLRQQLEDLLQKLQVSSPHVCILCYRYTDTIAHHINDMYPCT